MSLLNKSSFNGRDVIYEKKKKEEDVVVVVIRSNGANEQGKELWVCGRTCLSFFRR